MAKPKNPNPEPELSLEVIEAQIADIASVADDQLGASEQYLLEQIRAHSEDTTPESVEAMQAMAEAVKALREEATRRIDAASQVAEQQQMILAELGINAETPDPDPQPDGDPDDDGDEDEEGDGDGTDPQPSSTVETPAPDAEPEPIAAAAKPPRPSLRQIREKVPAVQVVGPREDPNVPVIIAAGGIDKYQAGQRLTPDQLREAFASKMQAMASAPAGARSLVASLKMPYPEERRLDGLTDEDKTRKINSVLEQPVETVDSLVAAGGICAPTPARYDLFGVGTDARPVRDALVRFEAGRGGLRYMPAPTLTNVSGAVDTWTEANDQNPSDPATKPCATITCPDEVSVVVDAVTACLQTGNFRRIFWPEQFRRWWELARIQHARVAEENLLGTIAANSIDVTDGQNHGTARDSLEAYTRAAAAYRSRHRMDRNAVLQLLLPSWYPDAVASDLLRQQPGDNTYAVTEADITRWFAARNIAVSYYLDTESGEAQTFAIQGAVGNAEAALLGWPANIVSYLFAPGSFLFLDGGELDLGIDIRDSTLNSTNDVQAFMETFEEAAFVGVESLKITLAHCVSGESQLPIDAALCPPGARS